VSVVDAEIVTEEYVYTSTITHPNGLTVTVTARIPYPWSWKDIGEVAELAQMGASQTINRIDDARKASRERCPF
jgi:hypothetical protein